MAKTDTYEKVDLLKEALRLTLIELTDELAAEHVEELIEELAEEAAEEYYGLVEDDNESDNDDPIDLFSDMDSFTNEDK